MKDISLFKVHMPYAVDAQLLEVLHSGYIGQGKKVDEFEAQIAAYLGNENVLTLNSGTSALELGLHLAGVKEGTSVVSTPMTCSATNTAIVSRGGRIIWADIDSETGLIDYVDVERKIEKDTLAVMGVDWGGQACNWTALDALSGHYGLSTIEDAAHALGAVYGDRRVGVLADFTAFSLQAIKSITSVDGGILSLRSNFDYKRGKLLRWYGIDRDTPRKDMRCEEDILEAGWKWHMNDVNAVIGMVQLQYLNGIVKAQRENARYYYENLRGPKSSFPARVLEESSFWLYTILCTDKEQRLRFMDHMKSKGVMTSQVHARCDTHTCFKEFKQHPLPGVDKFTERQVSIPVHWDLSIEDRDRVVDAVNSFYRIEKYASVEA